MIDKSFFSRVTVPLIVVGRSLKTLLAVLAVVLGVLFMIAGGGLVVLATLIGSAATLVAVPILWFSGKRRRAVKLFTVWGFYSAFYLATSTGIALLQPLLVHTLGVGQEICADSGCFAVDKVDRAATGPETAYTLFWHLASNDTLQTKRFPGKGLELFMFDERGRMFRLPDHANRSPLDVTLPPGETVRQTMTFSVPADAHELFLAAKYRPLTFQSLFPGELSLVPHRPTAMIRIQ